ncbi:MAG: RNA methyltransferase [Bacteroidales bacterium]|nr:RNA methyltransferase [Bacteroidales bacterium]
MDLAFIEYLSGFISERRLALFKEILVKRTRYISVVLEDIYKSHNASAVLRTCDAFGVQDVHIIESKNQFELSTNVTIGSDKWLSIKKYNESRHNTVKTFNRLREQGYRIVATTPHFKSSSLQEFDLGKAKVALVFGSELKGLSEEALNNADEYLYIPMVGFSESLNVSVSAAVILNTLSSKLRQSDVNWKLTKEEQLELLEGWLLKTLKQPDLYLKKYFGDKPTVNE